MRTKTNHTKSFFSLMAFILLSSVLFTSSIVFTPAVIEKKVNVFVFIEPITRENINAIVAKDELWFMQQYADHLDRNMYTVQTIFKYAKKKNLPLNLCLALGMQESKLINSNPKRPVGKNTDGSFDWGLYQLNSKTYPDVINKYGSIDKNAEQGITHLADEFAKYGNLEVSTMTYNCGSVKRITSDSIARLKEILRYEKELNEWVNSIYRDKVSRTFSSGQIPVQR